MTSNCFGVARVSANRGSLVLGHRRHQTAKRHSAELITRKETLAYKRTFFMALQSAST